MNIREIKNDLLGESYFEIKHPSGVTILVYPKPGYSSSYAIFGTNYGSIDAQGIPNGTAHFLEHKLFESEELDAFELFAKTGASANAYTSFDRTCYLFQCGGNFAENLKILLGFVQHPYFTEETVKKEQGIIGQEIRMYQDEPDWQVMFNLLRAAYVNHPVRIDIAGTCESIAEISAETLFGCYDKFYNLNNMVLACAGNTTVEEVLKICDAELPKEPAPALPTLREDFGEPYEVGESYIEEYMSVSMPQFALGFKEAAGLPMPTQKEMIMTNIITECACGPTTEFYNDLLKEGLISPNFGTEYFTGPGYRIVMFTGDSRDPLEVAKRIKEHLAKLKESGLEKADFERARRSFYGRSIMAFNDVDNIANGLVSTFLENYELFDEIEIFSNMTLLDVNEYLRGKFDLDNSTLSVIYPKEA